MAIRKPLGNSPAALKRRPAEVRAPDDAPKPRELDELREIGTGKGRLALGDRGPAVEEIQAAIGLDRTGVFDEKMKESIEGLQRTSGLAVTGVFDADTMFAMNTAFQTAAPLFEKFLGNEQRAAIEDLDKAVDEGTGLFAHKRIAATEFASLGLLTLRNAGEVSNKVGKALSGAGISKVADLVGPVLVPITAYYAAKDVRAAVKARKDIPHSEVQAARSKRATNRAAGSVGYFSSVAAGTAKEIIKASARSGGFLGKLVPGLNMIIAAGDITWATTVVRDPDSSKKKKACACASAVGSVISMVTPPPISWAASAIASGGLLASNFV